ncbi:hypothetical protein BLNAU_525 [Blattamonas nauphoetae]|uniref:Uncharacterized protein n=1 Tax=Blattamonas nauphoetae TaxID=2049346 RepID=A0ABQ9YLH6_9EUKA|nr:hypothetical protein BLNAU_525 [Blattamonas nauphoetae]
MQSDDDVIHPKSLGTPKHETKISTTILLSKLMLGFVIPEDSFDSVSSIIKIRKTTTRPGVLKASSTPSIFWEYLAIMLAHSVSSLVDDLLFLICSIPCVLSLVFIPSLVRELSHPSQGSLRRTKAAFRVLCRLLLSIPIFLELLIELCLVFPAPFVLIDLFRAPAKDRRKIISFHFFRLILSIIAVALSPFFLIGLYRLPSLIQKIKRTQWSLLLYPSHTAPQSHTSLFIVPLIIIKTELNILVDIPFAILFLGSLVMIYRVPIIIKSVFSGKLTTTIGTITSRRLIVFLNFTHSIQDLPFIVFIPFLLWRIPNTFRNISLTQSLSFSSTRSSILWKEFQQLGKDIGCILLLPILLITVWRIPSLHRAILSARNSSSIHRAVFHETAILFRYLPSALALGLLFFLVPWRIPTFIHHLRQFPSSINDYHFFLVAYACIILDYLCLPFAPLFLLFPHQFKWFLRHRNEQHVLTPRKRFDYASDPKVNERFDINIAFHPIASSQIKRELPLSRDQSVVGDLDTPTSQSSFSHSTSLTRFYSSSSSHFRHDSAPSSISTCPSPTPSVSQVEPNDHPRLSPSPLEDSSSFFPLFLFYPNINYVYTLRKIASDLLFVVEVLVIFVTIISAPPYVGDVKKLRAKSKGSKHSTAVFTDGLYQVTHDRFFKAVLSLAHIALIPFSILSFPLIPVFRLLQLRLNINPRNVPFKVQKEPPLIFNTASQLQRDITLDILPLLDNPDDAIQLSPYAIIPKLFSQNVPHLNSLYSCLHIITTTIRTFRYRTPEGLQAYTHSFYIVPGILFLRCAEVAFIDLFWNAPLFVLFTILSLLLVLINDIGVLLASLFVPVYFLATFGQPLSDRLFFRHQPAFEHLHTFRAVRKWIVRAFGHLTFQSRTEPPKLSTSGNSLVSKAKKKADKTELRNSVVAYSTYAKNEVIHWMLNQFPKTRAPKDVKNQADPPEAINSPVQSVIPNITDLDQSVEMRTMNTQHLHQSESASELRSSHSDGDFETSTFQSNSTYSGNSDDSSEETRQTESEDEDSDDWTVVMTDISPPSTPSFELRHIPLTSKILEVGGTLPTPLSTPSLIYLSQPGQVQQPLVHQLHTIAPILCILSNPIDNTKSFPSSLKAMVKALIGFITSKNRSYRNTNWIGGKRLSLGNKNLATFMVRRPTLLFVLRTITQLVILPLWLALEAAVMISPVFISGYLLFLQSSSGSESFFYIISRVLLTIISFKESWVIYFLQILIAASCAGSIQIQHNLLRDIFTSFHPFHAFELFLLFLLSIVKYIFEAYHFPLMFVLRWFCRPTIFHRLIRLFTSLLWSLLPIIIGVVSFGISSFIVTIPIAIVLFVYSLIVPY